MQARVGTERMHDDKADHFHSHMRCASPLRGASGDGRGADRKYPRNRNGSIRSCDPIVNRYALQQEWLFHRYNQRRRRYLRHRPSGAWAVFHYRNRTGIRSPGFGRSDGLRQPDDGPESCTEDSSRDATGQRDRRGNERGYQCRKQRQFHGDQGQGSGCALRRSR